MNRKFIARETHSIWCESVYDKLYFKVEINQGDLIYVSETTYSKTHYSNILFIKGSRLFSYNVQDYSKYLYCYYDTRDNEIRNTEIDKILND